MGYGDYSYEAHRAITEKRAALPVQEVFTQRRVHPLMSPYGVAFRESRDSERHPRTTSIVFALDVSGSMGAIPEELARRELPGFMKALLDAGVPDPQVLFMALQDAEDLSKQAPLQVGQFESTAELIDRWLTLCWVMGGGKTEYESYDLAMYFAARHTELDSLEKRGKKGYFVMTGDEECFPSLSASAVQTYLGETIDRDLPLEGVVAELRKSYHPFFLVPDRQRGVKMAHLWRKHFGPGVITLHAPEDTCPVAAGIVALGEGVVPSLSAVVEKLVSAGVSADRARRVHDALAPWAASIGRA